MNLYLMMSCTWPRLFRSVAGKVDPFSTIFTFCRDDAIRKPG